ncbi:hypothetical protein JB92DRAFT_814090 [Gautieria morchelliformis]|nr:hypothetical protein JB92DRAFT_814090 [Gautieria morchelliformis]
MKPLQMSVNPQTVATVVESLTATKYSCVASLAFLLYDHVITLDDEVVNVWNRPRSLSRWLFIWTRYFGLASLTMTVTVLFHGSLSNKVSANFSFGGRFYALNGLSLPFKSFYLSVFMLFMVATNTFSLAGLDSFCYR